VPKRMDALDRARIRVTKMCDDVSCAGTVPALFWRQQWLYQKICEVGGSKPIPYSTRGGTIHQNNVITTLNCCAVCNSVHSEICSAYCEMLSVWVTILKRIVLLWVKNPVTWPSGSGNSSRLATGGQKKPFTKEVRRGISSSFLYPCEWRRVW
jgi:hypothetical protein